MLIETELFGCVRNPLKASKISNTGLLAMPNGGTVYLDEIGELSLGLQVKLLRALQQKEVRPAGSSHAFPISSRVLAATNRDLSVMVDQGKFRKDLYVRLNVVNLRVPPLRERRGDIAPLVTHFLERVGRETGGARNFSENALQVMTEYDWPGNVGELEDSIERACALSSALVLNLGDLPTQLQDSWLKRTLVPLAAGTNQNGQMVSDADVAKAEIVSIAEIEKRMILDSIQQLKGDKMMAARLLGIGKTTLYRKLKEYGISEDS
jgi:two-component system response regulator HydG